ncbi:MAG: UdgX family uracil-DNA binding protein [Burkholderiaceae bacterium]
MSVDFGVGVDVDVDVDVVDEAMTAVALEGVTDWDGFSRAVRALVARGVAPEAVRWRIAGEEHADLFGDAAVRAHALPEPPPLRLPRAFVEAAREVFLHAAPDRFALLHGLAARVAADARHWDDPLHAERLRFERCLREVRREIHKMHAFVRFRPIAMEGEGDGADDGAAPVRHVAWFEPAHHVLEAAAPFFARRFATLRWAILTPRASVAWDGRALVHGPGARREDAPAPDAGEALWLAYYRSIFNPARVKLAMMKREMPVRFWRNLPEARQVGPMLAEAADREHAMIAAGGATRARRRGRAVAVGESTCVRAGREASTGAAARMHPDGSAELDVLVPDDGSAGDDACASAGRLARADVPAGLDALRAAVARCRDCPGADAATQAVFGEAADGRRDADARAGVRLVLVGEQPGDHEDLRGRPFTGPAGQLLREALAALGWPLEAVWLTNAVKHFHYELRGKRRLHKTPGQLEADACRHWLESELAALRPAAVVALGATAARSLLGHDVGVLANEGQWFARPDGLPVLVCLHPSALLRADASRRAELHARWLRSLDAATPVVHE